MGQTTYHARVFLAVLKSIVLVLGMMVAWRLKDVFLTMAKGIATIVANGPKVLSLFAGILKIGAMIAAVFMAFELGKWLYDQFEPVQVFMTKVVSAMQKVWQSIQTGAQMAAEVIKMAFWRVLEWITEMFKKALYKIGDALSAVNKWTSKVGFDYKIAINQIYAGARMFSSIHGDLVKDNEDRAAEGLKKMAKLTEEWKTKIKTINDETKAILEDIKNTFANNPPEEKSFFAFMSEDLERITGLLGRVKDLTAGFVWPDVLDVATVEPPEPAGVPKVNIPGHDEDEMNKLAADMDKVKNLADSLGESFGNAFESAILGAQSASEALKALLADMVQIIFHQLVTMQIANAISEALTGSPAFASLASLGAAKGMAFNQGEVVPMARGGIVGSPTLMPLSHGRIGLMGEAGPEAVMPLTRTRDGKLGVAAEGREVHNHVTMNVYTKDANSFRRSRTQIVNDFQRTGRLMGG